MSLPAIRTALKNKYHSNIVDELIQCYEEQKKNYFLGNLRPTEVEGGRFAEAAFRMLEQSAGFDITSIGRQLDTDGLIRRLQALPGTHPDAIRLHIPRTLRVVYDIRNKRDAAHLADGIDPNLQDASFVYSCLDWILAEFVRLSNGISATEAFKLVKEITVQAIPAIEEINGFIKTLKPSLGVSERLLVLLYNRGTSGATIDKLKLWVKPSQKKNIMRALNTLNFEKDFVANVGEYYFITRLGILEINKKDLLNM